MELKTWKGYPPMIPCTPEYMRLLAKGAYKKNREWRPRQVQSRRGLLSFKSGPLFEKQHMSFEQETA